jgi:nicotinamidase-related amidase
MASSPDLADLLRPAHTVLITQECQRGVIGSHSLLPALAEAAGKELVPNVARLAAAARKAGVRVVHCTAIQRPDRFGRNRNARLFQATGKAPVQLVPGSEAAEVVPEIGVEATDVVVPRMHGLSPFQGTELDSLLRNEGIRTLVVTGVSVNVAITNLTFDAVNAGYQVVLPMDAVAGTPREYAEAVFQHTLRNVATLVTADDVIAAWRQPGPLGSDPKGPTRGVR